MIGKNHKTFKTSLIHNKDVSILSTIWIESGFFATLCPVESKVVRLEDAACWPLWVGNERGVVGVALGHDLHLRWVDIHYGDGGPHEAQGVHLACGVSVDVGVCGPC